MRFSDLLLMSSANLFKRKVRSILTILGVVVGTASIVVMLSIGIGMKEVSMEEIEKFGGLTNVTVQEAGSNSSVDATNSKHLDDASMEQIKRLNHVNDVYPLLQMPIYLKKGNLETYEFMTATTTDNLERKNFNLAGGTIPENGPQLQLLYGNGVICDFRNKNTGMSYWDNHKLPNIDLMKDDIFVIFDTQAYESMQSQSAGIDSTDGSGDKKTVKPPKKFMSKASGVLAGGPEDYSENAWAVYANIDQIVPIIKKEFKNKAIPNQPTRKNGKPYKQIFYSSYEVDVDNVDNVLEVQNEIIALGYEAYSNAEWIESTQNQMQTIQTLLGGIGAVSLIVAAIGIANTMMMSIYERTKEIGVMKVLGCTMNNIRSLFLLEAGYIGFIGGVVGVGLSYAAAYVVNTIISGGMAESGEQLGIRASIPPWLALLGIIFAFVIGVLSGFFPALRAMKLSPLAAIRNE